MPFHWGAEIPRLVSSTSRAQRDTSQHTVTAFDTSGWTSRRARVAVQCSANARVSISRERHAGAGGPRPPGNPPQARPDLRCAASPLRHLPSQDTSRRLRPLFRLKMLSRVFFIAAGSPGERHYWRPKRAAFRRSWRPSDAEGKTEKLNGAKSSGWTLSWRRVPFREVVPCGRQEH